MSVPSGMKNPDKNVSYLESVDRHRNRLAYELSGGGDTVVLFSNGFQSCMGGSKDRAQRNYCKEKGVAFCSFDYRGHGLSSGNVADFTTSDWLGDARRILEQPLESFESVILVGSSMGAAISVQLAMLHPERVRGLLGIAGAPDFFHDLYKFSTPEQQQAWQDDGVVFLPTEYSPEPYPVPWTLIQDAKENWNMLDKESIPVQCPVRLIHGQRDKDVSWEKSLALADRLQSDDVTVSLVKSGNHRLSRAEDINWICKLLEDLLFRQT